MATKKPNEDLFNQNGQENYPGSFFNESEQTEQLAPGDVFGGEFGDEDISQMLEGASLPITNKDIEGFTGETNLIPENPFDRIKNADSWADLDDAKKQVAQHIARGERGQYEKTLMFPAPLPKERQRKRAA